MGKGTIFFCCSCVIFVLTIVNLSIGPAINWKLEDDDQDVYWGNLNCAIYKDNYDKEKDQAGFTDEREKYWEVTIDKCERTKAMYNMEYTSFIFDIVIGFICSLLGLLHIFEVKKDFVANTGLIGLICGVVGFVFSLVYIIFNGLVFTNNYSGVKKTDENGAFAKLDDTTGDKFKCLDFDDSGNTLIVYAKFSELNKKQYNYDKDLHKAYEDSEIYSDCLDDSSYYKQCGQGETFTVSSTKTYDSGAKPCPYLYVSEQGDIANQDLYDRFLTTLILSLVVCLANIGLALFGFLLFRTPGDF